MLDNYSDEQLKAEIKKREEARKGLPEWLTQPFRFKLFNYCSDVFIALMLIVVSPVWVPFWLGYKIYKWEQRVYKQMAKERGLDWKKYHHES